MNPTKNECDLGNQTYLVASPVSTGDEISLMDLWLFLLRRKQIILICMLLGIMTSLALVFTTTETYRFHTTIALGQLPTSSSKQGINDTQIDTPETVLAKLEEAYIPRILDLLANNTKTYSLEVSTPKNSSLVIIETAGPLKESATYLKILNDTANAVVEDHDMILAPLKLTLATSLEQQKMNLETIRNAQLFEVETNKVKQQITNAKLNLFATQDQLKIINNRLNHIEVELKLASRQRREIEKSLQTAMTYRADSMKQDNSPAVTLLILSSEIQHYQGRLAELDRLTLISLPEKRIELQKSIEDNSRAQQQQTDTISNIEAELRKTYLVRTSQEASQLLAIKTTMAQIDKIRSTYILYKPSRSTNPIGSRARLIILLGMIIGLMLGVFGAFVADLIAKAAVNKNTDENPSGA